MSKVAVQIKGADQVVAFLRDLDKKTEGLIDDIVKVNANEAAAKAKGDAKRRTGTDTPKNTGTLALSINVTQVRRMVYGVGTNTTYAPYQEFGTGKYAGSYVPTLPPTVRRLAAKYKGKGIRNVNIRAKKFLYDNVQDQIPRLLKDLTDAINGALK